MNWIAYLDDLVYETTKEDIYITRLIAETQKCWVEKPNDVKAESFIIKKPKPTVVSTVANRKQKMANSKAFWNYSVKGVQRAKS